MRESLRHTGRIVPASIKRVADRWYVSITFDIAADTLRPLLSPAENQGAVGVDLGVTALAALSTGERFPGPRALGTLLDSVRRVARDRLPARAGRPLAQYRRHEHSRANL